MLYIISKPENVMLAAQFTTDADELLLMQSAVYLSNPKHYQYILLKSLPCSISALVEDLQARGVEASVAHGIQVIDMDQFVDLTVKHTKSISW
ncbi:sulfurtransferase complex subunit TusB [Vibrio lamellibrachiae]|uniref:sulfurtransferase complex subunit TusB n=1 Tax=Vibrio lamellibrachiae TaxID=2910253 RepID=UPI003D0E4D31